MRNSEFIHGVESVTVSRDKQFDPSTHVITLVIKTEGGKKTMHLFTDERVEIQGGEDARLKAEWKAEALEGHALHVSQSYLSNEMLCAEDVHDGLLNAAKRARNQAQVDQ